MSEPPTPLAVPGDCVTLTGSEAAPEFHKVPCGRHNFTVAKVKAWPNSDEKCGAEDAWYARYEEIGGPQAVTVCLIPALTDGECYDMFSSGMHPAVQKTACGGASAARVKVLTNTADKAVCGPDAGAAFAYPETNTTYCFSK
ncbi:hypothetical protein [Lentzea sp. NPDC060358]|uniref:LppU/SCO3897 family protein n=1 Tax=Lentzea sp. NPDC060358 TaxID=3347103 RepID=UPI00364917D7